MLEELLLFYEEPNFDRWLPFDRIPRAFIRRILRGKPRAGGQMKVFLNLKQGLDILGVKYKCNDFRKAARNPSLPCVILGKRHVLLSRPWKNPLIVGPCVFDHPVDCPDLFKSYDIKGLLVPGPWMRDMCSPFWGEMVKDWPVGIESDAWVPSKKEKTLDFILYNKIRWQHSFRERSLLEPIRQQLHQRKLSFAEIRYGSYQPEQYKALLGTAKGMIFVCEHETQGLAYQEALSSGVPILAWDHGGEWLDPSYHPALVKYSPCSSVPYWSNECGVKFAASQDFPQALDNFMLRLSEGSFNPRGYILENLTLRRSAERFLEIYKSFIAPRP